MNKAKQFGETVEGYNIPVLNEREIRASAGILYFFTATAKFHLHASGGVKSALP